MKFRLIPAMMLVAALAFTVRVGDFVSGLRDMGAAHAQESVKGNVPEDVKASPPPMNADTLPAPKAQDAKEAAAANPAPLPDLAKTGTKIEWRDSTDAEVADSQAKEDLYKDLAKRRAELDEREKKIAVREALLSAAERELDQKTRELTTLKTQVEADLKQRSDAEDARINSLVKIYENMKPKDAAVIFNTLDIDVLMAIMTRMKERKSSPILALMDTNRAKTVTTMMAEQKKPPELPSDTN